MTHEQPIAVFQGRDWLRHAPGTLFLVGVVTTLLGIMFADHVPWPTALRDGPDGVGWLLSLAWGSTVVATAFLARARTGRAELFPDRLLVRSGGRLATVFLGELEAFDDRSSELVRVEGRSASVPTGSLFVPTPREADRTTLLEALGAAGVPRDDGQRRTTRADRAPPPLLAQVHVGPAIGSRGVTWLVGGVIAVLYLGLIGPCVLTPAAALLALGAVLWTGRRVRTIGLHTDRIVFDATSGTSPARSTIAWSDVLAWRSSAPSEVRLILRPGVVRDTLGQPSLLTPTPELRSAVEALLAERAVPRL